MRKDSWKESEILFLKKNYSKLTITKIAVTLGKNNSTITRKASKLGLRKNLDQPTEEIQSKSLVGLQAIKIDSRTTIYVKAGLDLEKAKKKFIEKYNYAIK
jgi:hypothetical protein